jgi:hypothetical protein
MRVRIEGNSLPAKTIRAYLEKHGAAVTEGLADLTVVIEQTARVELGTSHVELDTIPCPLETALLKHLSRLVNASIIVYMERTGTVTTDNRVVVRIPLDPRIERDAEIAVFRGVAEFLGRSAEPAPTPAPPKEPWYRTVAARFNPLATMMGAIALIVAIFITLAVFGRAQSADAPDDPKPISIEDRETVKDLQIKAQDAAIREKSAEAIRAQAELEIEHAQRDLDSVNAQIRAKTEELTKKYAPSGKWEITPLFGWTKKGAAP